MGAFSETAKYKTYKYSGEDWIAEIPAHWEVRKLKHLFREKKHTQNMALNCGSISFGEVVTKDDDKIPLSTKASYQEVLSGEFLINPLNLNYDLISLRIGLSKIDVVVSAGYIVLKEKIKISREYFNYLLHRYDVAYMKLLGSGVRQTISFNHIANSLLILPPETEQVAIASFLDQKTAQIDEAIAIKEKQIALLKERKQIIIQKAVTQGLNPNVQMKDSGVEWIGQIPAHWNIFRLKQGCRKITDGAHISPDLSSELHPFISTVNVDDYGNIDFERCIYTSQSCYDYLKRTGCSPIKDDVLFSKDGTVGRTAVVDGNRDFVIASSLVIIRPDKKFFSSNYLDLILSSGLIKKQTDSVLSGSALRRISIIKVSNLLLFKVPKEEQLAIVKFCEGVASSSKEAIELQLRQIEKLKEYKATLINSAVTGKIKVA